VNSAMVYERKSNKQVLYVLPITSILSKLPLVPVGDTGTAPRRRGAGPAADHSKRIRLAPREALGRVSLSAMPTALAVGRPG